MHCCLCSENERYAPGGKSWGGFSQSREAGRGGGQDNGALGATQDGQDHFVRIFFGHDLQDEQDRQEDRVIPSNFSLSATSALSAVKRFALCVLATEHEIQPLPRKEGDEEQFLAGATVPRYGTKAPLGERCGFSQY